MRRMILCVLLLGTLAVAGSAGASIRDDAGGGGGGGSATFGPYTIVTTDGGSCGAPWAADTIRRTYTVRSNGNGTFALFETDFGKFTTTGPASPGACQTNQPHGTTVLPGIQGVLSGYLTGTVSCTGPCVFNPAGAAACPPAACYRSVFVAAAFGPTAQLSVSSFRFDYYSSSPLLVYRHWVDQGTATTEQFFGDIATA